MKQRGFVHYEDNLDIKTYPKERQNKYFVITEMFIN